MLVLQATRGASLTDQPAGQRRVGVLVAVALGVVALDVATKVWVVASLAGEPAVEVVGRWLRLTYVRNPGAAFNLGGGLTIVFSLVAIGVSIAIIRVAPRLGSVGWAVALGGILGGALGNLIDRLFRDPGVFRGYVVDWIQVPNFPVFNVADSAIVCSAGLMVVLSLRGIGLDGRRVTG